MSERATTRDEEERIRKAYALRDRDARYSWLNPGQQLIVQGAERGLLAALRRAGLDSLHDRDVLEVGCGSGHWLRAMVQWGVPPERLAGVDILPDRLAAARARCASTVRLALGSATALPFDDASFDVVLQSTVFTSILDGDVRSRAASEMLRVLRADGVILWYDFFVDNPRNRDVRGVRKSEIRRLFPGCRIDLRRITLAPPLARRIAPRSWLAAAILSAVPFLCTHYVGIIRRPTI